jgi:hypothetical protein
MWSGSSRVATLSEEGSRWQGSFSKIQRHRGVGVPGLQLRFGVIRVRHGLLILQVGSGEHDECRESTVVSRAWACVHREGEKGSEGCPGLIL